MTAISKKRKNNKNANKEDKMNLTKISKTSFKSTDKMELKRKKTKQSIVCKSEKSVPTKQANKKNLLISQLKNDVNLYTKVKPNNKVQSLKVEKNVQKEVKKKMKLQSQKDYMKTLKKKDPEFFKAIIQSKDVLEGTGYSDEDENSMGEEEEGDSCYDGEEEENSLDEGEEEENSLDEGEEDSLDEIEDSKISSRKSKKGNSIIANDLDEVMDLSDNEQNVRKIKNSGKVTKNMVNDWKIALRNSKTAMSTFKSAEQALAAAIISIKGSEDNNLHSHYTVEGSQMFNSVVKFCLSEVAPALHKLFDLKSLSDRPSRNSNWKKLAMSNTAVKHYLKHLILLTKSITDAEGIEVLLKKGILPILPIYVELPSVGWNLMKHVITLWCTSYEKVRVLSLIAIFRLIRSFKEELREKCMKALYASYVKNCAFTSPVSWPVIDFMRISLVELYCLDQPLAYRHAFLYIKQLALHLRNALLVQKKERVQLVYNWQFIHCIRLWAELLGKTHPSKVLHPLIYPLVQVSIGVIGLMKTPKYFPLVFHVCSILTELSKCTDTFIPVMPPLLEILTSHRVHNRPKKTSMKPLQWDSIIKVSTSQMNESAFSDGIIDQVYDCLLSYLNTECASIGFPELVFIALLKIKSFQKKCKVPAYIKKLKHLIDLINENSSFIEQRRKDVQFSISDAKAIKDWEIATLQLSPPIYTFYLHLKNIKDKNIKNEKSPNDDYDSQNSEAVLKEKLSIASQKKIGHHLLVKKDIEELEMNLQEEEDLEEIKEEETEVPKKTKSKKRKENSSAATNGTIQPVKKIKTSNTVEDETLEDDIVKEMTFSDNDESSVEEENDVDNVDDEECETDNAEDEETETDNAEDEESEADNAEDEESEANNAEDEESEADNAEDEESEADNAEDEESEANNAEDEESEADNAEDLESEEDNAEEDESGVDDDEEEESEDEE